MSLIPDGGETPATTTETTTEVTTPPTETTEVTTPPATTDDTPAFLFAEGISGEGDAPEWFKSDKYKTVSDQAKGYGELESKFGSFTGSPKDGNYEIEGVDFAENPLMSIVAEWGAVNQLSNDGLAGLVEKVNELAMSQVEQDATAAKEALGDRADERLGNISQWAKNNLAPEEFEQFKGLAQTAGQVEVIEKLIGMTKNSKLVKADTTKAVTETAEEELAKMQLATDKDGKRMMDDPDYRKKYNAKKAQLIN